MPSSRGTTTALVAALASVLLVSACGPDIDGVVGVARQGGALVGVVVTCDHPAQGASLFQTSGADPDVGEATGAGTWTFRDEDSTVALVTFPLGTPLPKGRLVLRAWGDKGDRSTRAVHFTREQARSLADGRVLVTRGGRTTTVTPVRLREQACG